MITSVLMTNLSNQANDYKFVKDLSFKICQWLLEQWFTFQNRLGQFLTRYILQRFTLHEYMMLHLGVIQASGSGSDAKRLVSNYQSRRTCLAVVLHSIPGE